MPAKGQEGTRGRWFPNVKKSLRIDQVNWDALVRVSVYRCCSPQEMVNRLIDEALGNAIELELPEARAAKRKRLRRE